MSFSYAMKSQPQGAADAAAPARTLELPYRLATTNKVLEYVRKNISEQGPGSVVNADDVEVGHWDANGRVFTAKLTPLNAVRVVDRRADENGNASPLFFAGLPGFVNTDISADAIAMAPMDPICIMALKPKGSGGIGLVGGSDINAPSCQIQVASTDSSAFEVRGGSSVSSSRTCIAGSYRTSGSGSVFAPKPETSCITSPDPLAEPVPPPCGGCTHNNWNANGGSHSLAPGVSCGGIEATGGATLTFKPGEYILKDGPLMLHAANSVEGEGGESASI